MDGVEAAVVPSVVFRIPPPDPRLTSFLSRLHAQFEKLRKLWDKKHRQVRFNMVLNTMKTVRGWDLDTFLSIPPEQRDEIIKALNEDAQKLLSELDPNDPLAIRLRDELALTNEHFYNLLNSAQKGPGIYFLIINLIQNKMFLVFLTKYFVLKFELCNFCKTFFRT